MGAGQRTMSGSLKLIGAALAAAMAMLMAQAAVAEESGAYRAIRSYHNEYITVDHGAETFTGGFLRGRLDS